MENSDLHADLTSDGSKITRHMCEGMTDFASKMLHQVNAHGQGVFYRDTRPWSSKLNVSSGKTKKVEGLLTYCRSFLPTAEHA